MFKTNLIMPKQNKLPFIFINEETVERNTDFKKAYEAIKNSYALFSGGKSTTPKTLSMKVNNGMFFCFPSYLNNRKIFISKLATFYPKNRLKNLPSIQPYISIFDSNNGTLLAVISARYFAGVRTATTSAVGAKYLLGKNPKIMAIIGSGVQAKFHALVFSKIFKSIKEIKIYSPDKKHLKKFVRENQKILKNLKLEIAKTSEQATQDADIIACVTNSPKPVISNSAVKPGACVLAVGSMGKEMQEIPDELMARAAVVVDSRQQIDEYGEIAGPESRGKKIKLIGELGEFILKNKKLNQKNKITVFKHHGLPVTDSALAEIILKKYEYSQS
ncbi:TPA: hypothetical protein DIC21_00150 [Candidatus Uhrbacteria bacterium]|nr:hypothetical protein [Candidatus Uhrbacteria bacterium]